MMDKDLTETEIAFIQSNASVRSQISKQATAENRIPETDIIKIHISNKRKHVYICLRKERNILTNITQGRSKIQYYKYYN